jgi:hypothetical protein
VPAPFQGFSCLMTYLCSASEVSSSYAITLSFSVSAGMAQSCMLCVLCASQEACFALATLPLLLLEMKYGSAQPTVL